MLFDAGTTPDHSTIRTDPPSDLPAPALSSPRLRERPVQRVPARTKERSWNHQGKTTLVYMLEIWPWATKELLVCSSMAYV